MARGGLFGLRPAPSAAQRSLSRNGVSPETLVRRDVALAVDLCSHRGMLPNMLLRFIDRSLNT